MGTSFRGSATAPSKRDLAPALPNYGGSPLYVTALFKEPPTHRSGQIEPTRAKQSSAEYYPDGSKFGGMAAEKKTVFDRR